MSSPPPAPTVVCFGEILWDFLPEGAFPGGAPFNVAYHLHQHGLEAHIASAVGRDVLGEELRRRLREWRIATSAIASLDGIPTGYVRAVLNERGDARYDIIRDVAWDHIPAEPAREPVQHAAALVFGSLAQRSASNQRSLDTLLGELPVNALRVFDVNLRPPHDDLALVRQLATRATVLKLNAEEAARLCAEPARPDQAEAHARTLAASTGCSVVVITSGADGAGLLRDGRWHAEPGRRVSVVDTVGSGDAFLAALLAKLLGGADDVTALAHAGRTGEWVATCRGATPPYPNRG